MSAAAMLGALTEAIEEAVPPQIRVGAAVVRSPSQSATPRQRQHLAGREAAAQALSALGVSLRAPLARAEHGAPRWPAGLTGSIAHTHRLAVAVASDSPRFNGLGIDIEEALPLEAGVLELVSSASQLAHADALRAVASPVPLDLLVFCAKEAAFKTLSTPQAPPPELRDIDITVAPETWGAGSFTATTRQRQCAIHGRYLEVVGHVVTVCWHP